MLLISQLPLSATRLLLSDRLFLPWLFRYLKYRSLGTPPRLTLQARLLQPQRMSMSKRAVFERSRRGLSLDVSIGVHIPLVVEQSSLES